MGKVRVYFGWAPFHPHSFNSVDKPGRWMPMAKEDSISEVWSFLSVDLEYRLDRIEGAIVSLTAAMDGSGEPGFVDGGNDGSCYYGGGHVMVASDYADDDRVVMAADQCLLLLTKVREVMAHADYRNPDREPFPSFELDIIATGEHAVDEYWRRGGITPRMPDPPPT